MYNLIAGSLIRGSDQAVISVGTRHVLAPAVALGMILIFNELTDSSAG